MTGPPYGGPVGESFNGHDNEQPRLSGAVRCPRPRNAVSEETGTRDLGKVKCPIPDRLQYLQPCISERVRLTVWMIWLPCPMRSPTTHTRSEPQRQEPRHHHCAQQHTRAKSFGARRLNERADRHVPLRPIAAFARGVSQGRHRFSAGTCDGQHGEFLHEGGGRALSHARSSVRRRWSPAILPYSCGVLPCFTA